MDPTMTNQEAQSNAQPSVTAAAGSAAAATAGEATPFKDYDNESVTDQAAIVESPATATEPPYPSDSLNFGRHRRDNVSKGQMKIGYPKGNKKNLKKFYAQQNELIGQFLGAGDEGQQQAEEDSRMAPKILNASFTIDVCLFVIQLYAAVSTGPQSLFATAADAFMDLVSSFVESARTLGGGPTESGELYLIPMIFVSISNRRKGQPDVLLPHVPQMPIRSCILHRPPEKYRRQYIRTGHVRGRRQIHLVSGSHWCHCPAYRAGRKYYVEVDIIMDQDIPLRISHDVNQSLQRKLEGSSDVERPFIHIDYDDDHKIHQEH
ncbi:hypothetical protein GGS23DRAFT_368863 [Durotheca rogersii]|uniref:uncharacterized protein n=1 Tax=Durotheca rogersii TaxID=419775 RepID=UPI0022208728|nr:uncharacterized protein GGS23DRAFT_368863 [Durotheca rogersii]KAI5866107.1 hypothetical protein GGS23DRAFT_368863 [Durotheca rogersii]